MWLSRLSLRGWVCLRMVVSFVVIVVVMVDGMLLRRYCMLGEFFAWLGSSLRGRSFIVFVVVAFVFVWSRSQLDE